MSTSLALCTRGRFRYLSSPGETSHRSQLSRTADNWGCGESNPEVSPGTETTALGAAGFAVLRLPSGPGIRVDTANRLQGREFEIVIVVHPLSGRREATAFHLEAGRLCVLTSRHRQACIVVARQGITDLLDSHPSTDPVHLSVPAKFPDGWEANQVIMAKLAGHRIDA